MEVKIDTDPRPGSVYLVKEGKTRLSEAYFRTLLGEGRPGLVLSRVRREACGAPEGSELHFHWMSDDGAPDSLVPALEACRSRICQMPRSACILIDRLDFIIFRNGNVFWKFT